MKAGKSDGGTGPDPRAADAAGSDAADAAENIGIGAVTPRNFVRWALQRFPKGRLFR